MSFDEIVSGVPLKLQPPRAEIHWEDYFKNGELKPMWHGKPAVKYREFEGGRKRCPASPACEIFIGCKFQYESSPESLEHLETFSHDEMADQMCSLSKDGYCKKYKRMNEESGCRMDDKIHMLVWSHPRRFRAAKLDQAHFLTSKNQIGNEIASEAQFNHGLEFNESTNEWNCAIGLLESSPCSMKDLFEEAKENGLERVFSFTDQFGMPQHLTDEVFRKMVLPQHQAMGYPLTEAEILAVILYTGTDCCDDLRKTAQGRNDADKKKWAWLDTTLDMAIQKLAMFDEQKPPRFLYHGLNGVAIKTEKVKYLHGKEEREAQNAFYYSTHVSTTEERLIANEFMQGRDDQAVKQGTMIKIDTLGQVFGNTPDGRKLTSKVHNFCGNVSWISKFGEHEKEWLFSSRLAMLVHNRYKDEQFEKDNGFLCEVIEVNQMVLSGTKWWK